MILLDTDVLSLFLRDHPRVVARYDDATVEVATTIVSKIEVLKGRFESLLKAANSDELMRAQDRLAIADQRIQELIVVPFEPRSIAEFDRLRKIKSLKRIGRADLLIACIALANKATLVTRNLKHFRQIPGLKLENWAD